MGALAHPPVLGVVMDAGDVIRKLRSMMSEELFGAPWGIDSVKNGSQFALYNWRAKREQQNINTYPTTPEGFERAVAELILIFG